MRSVFLGLQSNGNGENMNKTESKHTFGLGKSQKKNFCKFTQVCQISEV